MDYRLTDPYLDPPGLCDANYSEETYRLPHTFWCYDPPADEAVLSPLPALANGFITFGCLNNFCKINESVLASWAPILHGVPKHAYSSWPRRGVIGSGSFHFLAGWASAATALIFLAADRA